MTAQSHPAILARRARVSRIRRAVAAGSVAAFIALFAGIYVQMAHGHDPALGSNAAASSGGTATTGSEQLPQPAPVTTSQS